MFVITRDIMFWTGSAWSSEYPDAKKYDTLDDALAVAQTDPHARKWTRIVENHGEASERCASTPEWDKLTEETQMDLLEWRNTSKPDADDLNRLAALYRSGNFATWRCPSCGDHVHEANPEDWSHFQGVLNNDRVSYPGSGPDDRRCNHCRMHNE